MHPKIVSLLATVAAAMLALAAGASADYVSTSTGGPPATPTIHAVSENGHVSLHNPEWNIECATTLEAKVESHGEGVTAKGNVSALSFSGCTNGWIVTVNSPGTLELHYTSGHNGTLTSSGATVTASFFFGLVTCRYKTESTHIGTLAGGNPATLHIEGKLSFHSGSESCGTEPLPWTGDYVTTGALYVEGQGANH